MSFPNEQPLSCESPSTQSQSEKQAPTLPEADPPKKRRDRFNDEQIDALEQFFVRDHIPSAIQRVEIAHLLSCPPERVRVWFQNRRRREKNSGRVIWNTPRSRISPPIKRPPDLCQVVETDFARLILEDDNSISTIPCTMLTISEWNRVNCKGQQDLMAWICEGKQCLVWFVLLQDYSFKMQVPLDNVKETSFSNVGPEEALLTLELIQSPKFFMKQNVEQEGVPLPCWRPCDDWTENQAATRCLRHVLGGPHLPLAYVYYYVLGHKRNAAPDVPHALEDTSSHPTLASTTQTHLSPIPNYSLYPHAFGVWDSVSTAECQTPPYDAKPLSNTYQGGDQLQPNVVYNVEQCEDIYVEHNLMVPSEVDVGVAAASPRHMTPWPTTFHSENDWPSTYASGNGHDHHHPLSTLPFVPSESQISDSQFHSTI